MKFFLFVLAVIIGLLFIKYTDPIVRTVGKNDWAEQYLGGGGTYTMWKLIGVGLMILALVNWIGWRL